MFEMSLQDLVKAIRAGRSSESAIVSKAVTEIKNELKDQDPFLKAQAIQKLVYLHMLGYDMGWAAFHVVEVMSQPWFGHRRIGYLAACQSFSKDTDVILLTTHLFRKAFSQGSSSVGGGGAQDGLQYEVGAAINCLANVVTRDLAEDLLSDIYGMMNSSRPYIRKKACLVLLNVFHMWPKALRLSFDRLKEKLTDSDPGVVSAAVYVVCELARKNPKNYLKLAPLFFKILTTSSNNWVLIKVVKLLGSLVPLEPRLAKKLANPLTEIIEVTPAKSLLYECVNTLLSGELTSKSIVKLCLNNLTSFIEDPDQNLKYLGLLGLHKLMKQHPRAVAEHRDLILSCLSDEDVTIRMRALDLLTSMVSKRTIKSIIRKLTDHLNTADGQYRVIVLDRIIDICSKDHYAFVGDFEWYVETLVELTHVQGASKDNADRIKNQLMDVTIRVEGVRRFAVAAMVDASLSHLVRYADAGAVQADLLLDGGLLHHSSTGTRKRAKSVEDLARSRRTADKSNPMTDVLYAAAWIVGEFAVLLQDHFEVITALLSPQVASLSEDVQNVFIHSVMKVLTCGLLKDDDPSWATSADRICSVVIAQIPLFSRSAHVEVQERAVAYAAFAQLLMNKLRGSSLDSGLGSAAAAAKPMDVLNMDTTPAASTGGGASSRDEVLVCVRQFAAMFAEPLNPVNPKAQKKVPVPKGLDLDAWINEPPKEETDDFWGADDDTGFVDDSGSGYRTPRDLTPQELQKQKEKRERAKARREHDPYYIKSSSAGSSVMSSPRGVVDDNGTLLNVDDIPIKEAGDFDLPPVKVERRKGRKRGFTNEDVSDAKQYSVNMGSELPKGAEESDDSAGDDSDEDELGKVNLDAPLDENEVIPRVKTYAERNASKKDSKKKKKKKKEKDKKKAKKKDKKKKDKKKKSKESAEPAASKTADILDMFDPVGGNEEKKHKKKHKKKEKESVDAVGSSSKHHKHHHKHKHHFRDAAKRVLYEDNYVQVWYWVRAKSSSSATVHLFAGPASEEKKPDAGLAAAFDAPAHKGTVGDLTVTLSNNNHIRVKDGPKFSFGDFALENSEDQVSVDVGLQLAKLTAPQQLDAKVSYTLPGGSTPVEASPKLSMPLSALVQAKKISTTELQDILTRPGGADSCTAMASAKITLSAMDIQAALKAVCHILNVKLLEAASFTATYYGHTFKGQHVAVLVKASKQQVNTAKPVISVDLKCGKQYLADALMEELQQLLR